VLELRPLSVGVVRVQAGSESIDRIAGDLGDSVFFRLSPKEALLLCEAEDEDGLLEQAGANLQESDPGALAVTDSDSFAAWALEGQNVEATFARLSAIPLPATRPCLLQGLVADVPAKVIAAHNRLVILVGSPVSHHLRTRVLESGVSGGIIERDATSLSAFSQSAQVL
jgi:hypothetical protein